MPSPNDEAEVADLLARCRVGSDARAWDELFDRFYPVASRFVFQLSAGFTREDTEEICQEAFLAVIRHLGDFDGRSAFQTWLLRIAANKALDFRQKNRALKRGAGAEHFPLGSATSATASHIGNGQYPPEIDPACDRPGPDLALLRAEEATMLRACLDDLGDPCREIIELRYYGDLSYEEISAALRLNIKTVSSRLSKCLDRLGSLARRAMPWHVAVSAAGSEEPGSRRT